MIRALSRLSVPLLVALAGAGHAAPLLSDTLTPRVPLAYAARGLPAGDFRLFPSLGVTLLDNDNVFAREAPATGDLAWRFRPALRAESQWARHHLRLALDADSLRYQEQLDENVNDYRLALDHRLDLARGSRLRWHLHRARRHEPRGTPEAVPGLHPTPWDDTGLALAFSRDGGRLTLDLRLAHADIDYHDVAGTSGPIDNDHRDRTEDRATLRLGRGLRDWRWAYLELGGQRTDYRLTPGGGGVNRDQRRLDLALGLRYALSGKTRLEGRLGQARNRFDDPALGDFDTTLYRAALHWEPTRLARLTLTAERQVEGTTLAGASGVVTRRITLSGEQRLRRNLVLAGRLQLGRQDYPGLDRRDETRQLDLALRRLVNRNLTLTADFSRRQRLSTTDAPTDNFTQNQLSVGLLLHYD